MQERIILLDKKRIKEIEKKTVEKIVEEIREEKSKARQRPPYIE